MRVSPPMMRPDSILQIASIVGCRSVAVTTTDHTTFFVFSASPRALCLTGRGTLSRIVHLSDFGLAFPTGPVFLMKFHEAHRAFDSLLLGFQFELRVSPNDL